MTTATEEYPREVDPATQPVLPKLALEADRLAKQSLTIQDDATEEAATLVIARCRIAERDLESERKAQTDPLNIQIKRITEPYKKAIDAFASIRMEFDRRLQAYRRKKELERQERQRQLIADQERARREADAKAAEAKRKLEEEAAALAAREVPPSKTEQKRLDKLEEQAQHAHEQAMAAAMETPPLVETAAKTIILDDGTKVTARGKKDWVYTNGVPKEAVFDRTDVRFKELPDECFVIDPKRINARVKVGIATPGVTIVAASSSTVTKAKA